MQRIMWPVCSLLILGLVSCGSPSTGNPSFDTALVPETTLDAMVHEANDSLHNSLVETLYYCGSDANYDYYIFSPSTRMVAADLNKVSQKKNTQADRMSYTRDKTRWVFVAGNAPRPA